MLRLNRKKGQAILMKTPAGEMIEIQVLECTGNQVHLGVEAPRGIEVWREELFHIVMENKEAAKNAVDKKAIAKQMLELNNRTNKNT